MTYLVMRWDLNLRTYTALPQRFDTYAEAEAFGAECHANALPNLYRFLPTSAARFEQKQRRTPAPKARRRMPHTRR